MTARPGVDFAESFVRQAASLAAEELAGSVRVTRDPASEEWVVTCRKRTARAEHRLEPAEFARELERAVETVMGLREPEGGVR